MTTLLPNLDQAYVDQAKITEYLLSSSHPDGWGKAEFFIRHGFRVEQWQELAGALRQIAAENPVTDVVETSYGTRYTVVGSLIAPDGRTPRLRTIWLIERGTSVPRLITAYPA